MMVNLNYSEIISRAKLQGTNQVDFTNTHNIPVSNPSNQDTLTLSSQALSLSKGDKSIIQEVAPIYARPQTASELLAQNKDNQTNTQQISTLSEGNEVKSSVVSNSRFEDMMQAILDKRLGVDRKKLEELDAMMEAIAKNENLSPEEKATAMEEIAKMREEIIEESIEVKKIAKEDFVAPEDK